MSFVAAAIAGSAIIGAGAAIYGANQQSQALSNASSTIATGQSNALSSLNKALAPYLKTGGSASDTLMSLLTPGPNQTSTLEQIPGFQFNKAITNEGISAGAGRTGISGTTAVQGGQLGSQLASNAFGSIVNPLTNIYGASAGAAQTLGRGSADIFTGGAQSLAGLQVGQGNIAAGAAGGIGNTLQNALLFNALRGSNGNPGAFTADLGQLTQTGQLPGGGTGPGIIGVGPLAQGY